MKVPFRLRKSGERGDLAGVLLLSADVRELLALCGESLPPIFLVPGGFLIQASGGRQPPEEKSQGADAPRSPSFAGAIRLRRLAENLFLPVDAELVPALLEDEAAGLTRDRGLVFLPGGRVLAFAPDKPLTAADLLTCPRRPSRVWQPLPPPPAQPERLREVLLDLPNDTPETILETGAGDIGSEAPRPEARGPGAGVAGGAALGTGRGLMWLGRALGWRGLARLGARMARRAIERVPRLSEAVLGRRGAALRELLRQFREGNLDQALRRALPLNSPAGRGGTVTDDDRLPMHNLVYNLRDLLGEREPARLWLGDVELQAELAREYRKAAEDATARGDYRRAAFIYAKLLHDYRLAAAVLARGGLHHDAAVLYLEKLNDTLSAARAFEAAGEVDRALQLYRRRGEHTAAGDLLRRAGEEELALEEYRIAAAVLAAADNYLGAGELLLERGRRPDLALEFLTAGWERRPRGSAQGCLMRLAQIRASEESPRALLTLTDEADSYFAPPGNDSGAAAFYNRLATLGDSIRQAEVRDDLRDRALMGLAHKLRQRSREESRPGGTISQLLGQSGAWSPAVVSDADFAFKAGLRKPPLARIAPTNRVLLGTGDVTAVCAAPLSGRVFAGFSDGDWACFDPSEGHLTFWHGDPEKDAAVAALSTDGQGSTLVVLYAPVQGSQELTLYVSAGTTFRREYSHTLPAALGPAWLTPVAQSEFNDVVGLWHGRRLTTYWARILVPTGEIPVPSPAEELGAALLLRVRSSGQPLSWMLFHRDRLWHFGADGHLEGMPAALGWRPVIHSRNFHSSSQVSWQKKEEGQLELAGVGEDGTVHWADVHFRDGHPAATRGATAATSRIGYLATCLLGPGRVAAVRRAGIDWLRRDRNQLLPWSATATDLSDAVACFVSPLTNELLVVGQDAWLTRLPIPH